MIFPPADLLSFFLPSLRAKRSNPELWRPCGLLRFARNDGLTFRFAWCTQSLGAVSLHIRPAIVSCSRCPLSVRPLFHRPPDFSPRTYRPDRPWVGVFH